MGAKYDKMKAFLPSIYNTTDGSAIAGLLAAWANEDDLIVSTIQAAHDQLFIQTAERQYLQMLASNLGVNRPIGFNVADSTFSRLIPYLSFYPKQVIPTIKGILDVIFGVGNLNVGVHELSPNVIVITLPLITPIIRGLKGSAHLKNYHGTIGTIDNIAKTIVFTLDDPLKQIKANELTGHFFASRLNSSVIASHTVGVGSIVLTFGVIEDLTVYTMGNDGNISNSLYPSAYKANPLASDKVVGQRGTTGQIVNPGDSFLALSMADSSHLPQTVGTCYFDYGTSLQEGPVNYFGRPTDTVIFIDPAFIFAKIHPIGSAVNFAVTPDPAPRTTGLDYSFYLANTLTATTLAQFLILNIVAAGIIVKFNIN